MLGVGVVRGGGFAGVVVAVLVGCAVWRVPLVVAVGAVVVGGSLAGSVGLRASSRVGWSGLGGSGGGCSSVLVAALVVVVWVVVVVSASPLVGSAVVAERYLSEYQFTVKLGSSRPSICLSFVYLFGVKIAAVVGLAAAV